MIRRRQRGEDGAPRGKQAPYREEDVDGSSSGVEPGSSDEDARTDLSEYEGSAESFNIADENPTIGLTASQLKEVF